MCEELQARLTELKSEFLRGQDELERLEGRRIYLRETLLRLSGAMQVLGELLADDSRLEQGENTPGAAPSLDIDPTATAVSIEPHSIANAR